ncbi:hypothetical protein BCR36DRAFT_362308 [Piromyces finnis]|uniref:Uncharacterized protein n=1 Tax=Piromyces finnis TaxID=1754191 RepID=A0A1Y1UXU2_9FUNG|nr:hypothetical protein BCR36DRAFT_362308 [Piromyces finnis]|eukprot:ORX42553.1 hypothetical protein BCR36DRAFT_362308 [Piromyces finnis]
MGVKKLNAFMTKNIKLEHSHWNIDKKEYYQLQNNEYTMDNKNEKNELNLIIDANSFFYYLANQLKWFVFDNISFFKLLKKYLFQLLAINNLEKIFFVFDGMDTDIKKNTNLGRADKRVKSIKKFYNKIVSNKKKNGFLKPEKICATPLLKVAYAQLLFDAKDYLKKLDVRFSLFEADSDIAYLAKKYNGYVISNDSDFYIYDIPGYINIESLIFTFTQKSSKIYYKIYKNTALTEYLGISKEYLPIFATLCDNDYFTLSKYPSLLSQINHYNNRDGDDVKSNKYISVSKFLLEIKENVDKKCSSPDTSVEEKQKLIISELFKFKNKEKNEDLEKLCYTNLVNSVNEYNLTALKYTDIKCINKDILHSYYNGKIYDLLLNVLYNHFYKCTQYFENLNKENCWLITKKLRLELYELLLLRNYQEYKPSHTTTTTTATATATATNKTQSNNNTIPKEYSILEYYTDDNKIAHKEIIIPIDSTKTFPTTLEEKFIKYLDTFHSNIDSIKKLPYYLMVGVANLRFYLIEKIKNNTFAPEGSSNSYIQFYNTYKNNNERNIPDEKNISNTKTTVLHTYEFEALVASCVAALSFSYLHKSIYIKSRKYVKDIPKNLSNFSIENNLKENKMDCSNTFTILTKHYNRSLKLKRSKLPKKIHNDISQFGNSVQIYAEFINVLLGNCQLMQILKLNDAKEEFNSLFTMYHYSWEEAFYSMVDYIKENGGESIFNELFDIKNKDYLNFLEKVYSLMLNTILSLN